jgi:hypothetical protein
MCGLALATGQWGEGSRWIFGSLYLQFFSDECAMCSVACIVKLLLMFTAP